MKKIFRVLPFLFIALILTAFGCQKFGGGTPKIATPSGWSLFTSSNYKISLAYPENMEVNDRAEAQQDSTYAGLQGKFFASLRETKREEQPTSIALFYAFADSDFDKFSASLVASDQGSITIKETTDVTQGGLEMKKIVSTTASGMDKTHYLFQSGGSLIVVSVVLGEEEVFAPVFATLQKVE